MSNIWEIEDQYTTNLLPIYLPKDEKTIFNIKVITWYFNIYPKIKYQTNYNYYISEKSKNIM